MAAGHAHAMYAARHLSVSMLDMCADPSQSMVRLSSASSSSSQWLPSSTTQPAHTPSTTSPQLTSAREREQKNSTRFLSA